MQLKLLTVSVLTGGATSGGGGEFNDTAVLDSMT
jgi:hypothetical protein